MIVQGKTEPVKVYELRGRIDGSIAGPERMLLDHYERGLATYKKSEWEEASALFGLALGSDPEDAVCKIYLDRMKQQRPPVPGSAVHDPKS